MIINLGSVDEIPMGQGICYVVKDKKIAAFHLRNGEVAVIENTCPHKEGNLCDGLTGEVNVVCPQHGHKFDLETGIGSEEGESIKVFKSWVEDGNIMFELK